MCTNPFRYFKTSPEIIRLAVMLYLRFPLPLRNVEHLLHEHGIDVIHETVRYWWNRFGPIFAAEIRHKKARCLATMALAFGRECATKARRRSCDLGTSKAAMLHRR